MACCFDWRMLCLDNGLLHHMESGVSGSWHAASLGGWCVNIMVCLDNGVLCQEDGVSGLWRATSPGG
jgi:hypothetical protein